jgi:hypothetical protein
VIELPDLDDAWSHENAFWLSCDATRMSKVLAHYELFKQVVDLPGAIVECGVFKGVSFARFAMMRELLTTTMSRKLIGFDVFGRFPETDYETDVLVRERFVEAAGEESIGVDQMRAVLEHKGLDKNVDLVAGDITQTVPAYVAEHPELRIALINLDTDIYEPAVTILEHLYPRIVPGGILVLDDYGTFPGETDATDMFFAGKGITVERLPWAMTPCFIRKPAS